jgi:hypothetical protein
MGTQNYYKKHGIEKQKQNLLDFRDLIQALIKEKRSCGNIKIEGQNVMIGCLSPSMLLLSDQHIF